MRTKELCGSATSVKAYESGALLHSKSKHMVRDNSIAEHPAVPQYIVPEHPAAAHQHNNNK